MARAELERTLTYKLVLSQAEATWLMNVIQNPLSSPESSFETNIRSSIFMELKDAKVKR